MLVQIGNHGMFRIGKIEHQLIAVCKVPVVGEYKILYQWSMYIGDPGGFRNLQSFVTHATDFGAVINFQVSATGEKLPILVGQPRAEPGFKLGNFMVRSAG